MLERIKYIFILLIIYINIGNVYNACIPGDNCPNGQGYCQVDTCVCNYGYQTLATNNPLNQKYCNYSQSSRWAPFILELFLPSIGMFYIGRFMHGAIKLALAFFVGIYEFGKKESENNNFNKLILVVFWAFYGIDLVVLLFAGYSDGYGFNLL